MLNDQQKRLRAELDIDNLAREIARQRSPYGVLASAASPHEVARALYLLGWRAPSEVVQEWSSSDPEGETND